MQSRYILLLSLFLYWTPGSAQQVNYSVKTDDPSSPAKVVVNLDLLGLDMPLHSLEAINDMSFNFGVWGTVDPVRAIGADFRFQRSYFVLGNLSNTAFPNYSQWQVGAHLFFADRTAQKVIPVVLDQDSQDDYSTNTRTTTTKYITVPAQVRRMFGARGGLYRRSGSHSLDVDNLADGLQAELGFTYTHHRTTGFYAGIFRRKITNLVIQTDTDGRCMNSAGRDFGLDLLVLPVNTFRDPVNGDADVSASTKAVVERGFPVGARAFWSLFQVAPREQTGKHFGLCGTGEVGYMPYTGFYIQATFGLTIIKK